MRARRVELVCGVLGGVLGLAALAVALFAPLTRTCVGGAAGHSRDGCFYVSAVQQYGLASQSLGIAVFSGLSLGIILFTLWHVRSQRLPALILLWACAILLSYLSLLGLDSVGLVFVPANLLAYAASIAGTVARRERAPALR
ncbi:MAG TPA: hypothetical protein VIC85_03075 [Ktedonobacterales bacterium]|jgi:hypothetical protein